MTASSMAMTDKVIYACQIDDMQKQLAGLRKSWKRAKAAHEQGDKDGTRAMAMFEDAGKHVKKCISKSREVLRTM